MEEDEMNGGNNKRPKNRKHPLSNTQKKAENISKGASKVSEKMAKSAEKHTQKAAMQSGAKATKSATMAAKRTKQAQKMAKVAKGAQKVAGIVAKLGPIIAVIGMIIVIIISVIGVLVFIIAGLGLIMSGLQKIATAFGDKVTGFILGKEHIVHDDDILGVLEYLQEMDYDLYGYGFSKLPDPIIQDDDGNNQLNYPSPEIWDPLWTSLPKTIKHEAAYRYIIAYLVADNYSNILQHQDRTLGDLFTFKRGNGLIALYHELGELGKKGEPYKKTDVGAITVENDKLKITETSINMFTRYTMEYDLKGWAGRYGMPLEFLLSVHLATMAPDLSYKMATEFDTEVEILLHAIKGNIDSAAQFKGANEQITYGQLQPIQGERVLDRWFMTDSEAKQIFNDFDGIIESYVGNEVSKWKCLGPGTYEDKGHGEWMEEEDYRNRS